MFAIAFFELHEKLGVAARGQKPLPLGDVELLVGLEIRQLHHFRGRGRLGRVDHFLVADGDAQAMVRLLEHHVLHQLIHHPVFDLLFVFIRDLGASPLLAVLLERRLERQLELLIVNRGPVHPEDHIAPAAQNLLHLSDGQPQHEEDRQWDEDPLRELAHGAHHHCGRSSIPVGG